MTKRILLAGIVVLLISVSVGKCALIELEFSGTVSRIAEPGRVDPIPRIEGYVDIGDSFSGILKYDTSAPDVLPEGYAGRYLYSVGPSGISLSTGEHVFMTNPQSVDFEVKIYNDTPTVASHDYFGASSWENLPFLDGYVSIDKIGIAAYADHTWIASADLPTSENELLGWDTMRVSVSGTGIGGEVFGFEGDITSMSIIPEPATVLFLVLGGIGLRVLRAPPHGMHNTSRDRRIL